MTTKRDLYTTYRFWVEIDQIAEAAFSECTGLQVELEIFEWEEGGENGYRHRLPARAKLSNIVLKRGIASLDLWRWFADTLPADGRAVRVQRRGLAIVLCGYAGMPEVRWNIKDALPIKWVGPSLKTGSGEVAVETVELAHHGLTRVK